MGDHKPKGYDAALVDTIVGQVKSQGLFDQFRRECLADVDTKPAFTNLRQLVDNTVLTFLSKQQWTPELNKNHLRDKLRRHIVQMNFLDAGVERIVEQVVNLNHIRPKIEEMLYDHLGIEKPKVEEEAEPPGLSNLTLENAPPVPVPAEDAAEPPPPPPPEPVTEPETSNMSVEETDLLPTDLEAVSPDSAKSCDERSNNPLGETDSNDVAVKVEPELSSVDREEVVVVEEEQEVKTEEDVDEESPPYEPLEAETESKAVTAPPEECALKTESQESDISGLTSQDSVESEHCAPAKPLVVVESSNGHAKDDSQLSQVSSDTQNSSKFEPLNAPSEEEPLKMDISEEAQMPSSFPEGEKRTETSDALTSFGDLQKEAITFEQAKRDEEDEPAGEAPKEPIPSSIGPSGEVNKILVKASVAEDTEESLLDSGDSMDLKIVESDSQGSVSHSNLSADQNTRDSKKESHSRGSSHRSRSQHDHHRSSSSSASQHRSSGHKTSSSSSSRDKERSGHRSRDHHKSSSDRSKSSRKDSSRRREDRDRDRDREKDKEREKERSKDKKSGDSCRDRGERRSTDRDSNDGANNGSQSKGGGGGVTTNGGDKAGSAPSTTAGTATDNQQTPSSSSSPKTTSQSQSANSPVAELTDRVQQPIVVDQFLDGKELNLQMRVQTSPKSGEEKKVLKKPKIAANLKEAMKLMKVRKRMDLEKAKEEERAAVELNRGYGQEVEENLLYFPEPSPQFKESRSERWWMHAQKTEEEQELISEVKASFERIQATLKRPAPSDARDKAKDSAGAEKKPKVKDETKAKGPEKPINGLTNDVDMDDYHEAEIDLDDLSLPLTENNNVQKENKNYRMVFNKLVNGDAELELTTVPEMSGAGERTRVQKASVTQTQRYTSEDLYKPRPVIGRSRRSRAFDGADTEGSR